MNFNMDTTYGYNITIKIIMVIIDSYNHYGYN